MRAVGSMITKEPTMNRDPGILLVNTAEAFDGMRTT
jgi:hypothetical protein